MYSYVYGTLQRDNCAYNCKVFNSRDMPVEASIRLSGKTQTPLATPGKHPGNDTKLSKSLFTVAHLRCGLSDVRILVRDVGMRGLL